MPCGSTSTALPTTARPARDNVRSDVEHVTGGAGADVCNAGADYLDGGTGNDTLSARDSVRDSVFGGTGTDEARRDSIDGIGSVESFFQPFSRRWTEADESGRLRP